MIAEFYENCDIFITGGSGVVGKAAIEKLLRSCNVKKIYILLRCKKGVSAEDRLKDIKDSRIFNVLKGVKPNELDKLVPIPGDTGLDGLGISPEHREMLKNVSVFIHSAATTRFDEPLKTAIRLNIKSTLESLKLAETLKNLKIFIHVSTFFSNPYVKFVEDKVYPPLFDWRVAMKMLDDDEISPEVDVFTAKVRGDFPNTYVFTKHLAEQVVNEYRFKVPVGIYRPSVVITALEDPEPGFTETRTGIMGLFLVWGAGVVQILFTNRQVQVDMVPLDITTKVLLMFAARAAHFSREKIEQGAPVSNCATNRYVEFNMGQQCAMMSKASNEFPFEKTIWIPDVILTTSSFLYMLVTIFLQLLPSLLIDGLLKLFGQKPIMMMIQRKIYVTLKALEFFMINKYSSNGITDMDELVEIGKGTDFCVSSVLTCCNTEENAQNTLRLMTLGCRRYLMNEDDSTLPRSKMVLRCKIIAYNLLKGFALFFIGRRILRVAMDYI